MRRRDFLNTLALGAGIVLPLGRGVWAATGDATANPTRKKLVVVMQSEMGRTPDYNKGNGKDHWSIGSVMFLGPGINGDRVIGATDEKQFHVPLNPQTLATEKETGIRVRPEHIHLALRQFAGIADHPLSKKFPLGIPEKETLQGLWG